MTVLIKRALEHESQKEKQEGVLVYSANRAKAMRIAKALEFFGYRVAVVSDKELDVAILMAKNKEELRITGIVTTDESLHKFSGLGLGIRVAQ